MLARRSESVTKTLVLFDIDGTLLQTLGAGIRGMNAAFARLHGRADALDDIAIAGRTDLSIVGDAFAKLGLPAGPTDVLALRDAYFDHLGAELARPVEGFFGVLPGVPALLDDLDRRDDVAVGLLTGNFVGGAEIKLGHFDLWRRFSFGAFGDDHLDRRDLVPVAVARAKEQGITAGTVIVIGDTPLDIACAHAHGAMALAVATGPYPAADLARANLVVPTLETLPVDWLTDLDAACRR
jgi:phosphoglycolate phosphatase-like HAD superfamily hydrolase